MRTRTHASPLSRHSRASCTPGDRALHFTRCCAHRHVIGGDPEDGEDECAAIRVLPWERAHDEAEVGEGSTLHQEDEEGGEGEAGDHADPEGVMRSAYRLSPEKTTVKLGDLIKEEAM